MLFSDLFKEHQDYEKTRALEEFCLSGMPKNPNIPELTRAAKLANSNNIDEYFYAQKVFIRFRIDSHCNTDRFQKADAEYLRKYRDVNAYNEFISIFNQK